MGLFKKKNDYSDLYDEDGYFIDTTGYPTQNVDNNDNVNTFLYQSKNSLPNKGNDSNNKILEKMDNNETDEEIPNVIRHQVNNQEEEIDRCSTQKVKVLGISFLVLYVFLILLGMFSTSFKNGYEPQIVTAKLKGQRIIYNKTRPMIDFLNNLNEKDFNGIEKMIEDYKNNTFLDKIPKMKHGLIEVNNKKKTLDDLKTKINTKEFTKILMIDMIYELLIYKEKVLNKAIATYEVLSNYNSANANAIDAEVQALKEMHNGYINTKTKTINEFDKIKVHLKYFD
ncbi:MAG: hypothetical protein ACOCP4_01090 [Candidatus Woesearchaeota archaeon]